MYSKKSFLLLFALVYGGACFSTSMFYCGFGGDFCGQSNTNDVNSNTDTVILAFVNTAPDGRAVMDEANYPHALVDQWKSQGKKVVASVGGQNGNWGWVFASESSVDNFISSLVGIVGKHDLDGVDLDIESYQAAPRTVANMIKNLKLNLGSKLLIVSPECVAVYQGSPVPSPDAGGQAFNYFVPIIRLVDQYIDYYQPQAYNNWYDGLAGGSLDYLKDVYLNWRNMDGLSPWGGKPIPDFQGVKGEKLLMGVLASTQAGGAAYYYQPSTIQAFKHFLTEKTYPLKGFMIWDSHWDASNGYQVSSACK